MPLSPLFPAPSAPARAFRLGIALMSLSPLLFSPGAAAEDDESLEVITVTADKRSANLMDVPSSLSVVTEQDLKDAEITSIAELSQHVPNLHIFTWGGSRESNIFIRGIGPGLFTDPTVGFYVDGVNYTNNGMFDFDLMGVERIEILRGPQGTLYGGNSLAGIINVITEKPDNATEWRLSMSADSLEDRKLSAALNTALINDELFAGLSYAVTKNDGHLTNLHDNSSYGKQDDVFARMTLRWLPSDTLEANLALDYLRRRDDSYALGPAEFIRNNPEKVNLDFRGQDNRDSIGATLSITKSFEDIDFTSITGWRDWDSLNSADQDAGSHPQYRYNSTSDESQKQYSQEFRLASTLDSALQWLGGFYAYRSEYDVNSRNDLDYTLLGYGGPYVDLSRINKVNSGYAIFGQLDYHLTDKLVLTAGLRLDHEKREADLDTNNQSSPNIAIHGDKNFEVWLPKVGASYTFDDNAMLYATISRGYRAGGFDHLYPNAADPTYDEETSTNYEIGYKTSLLDDRLDLSAALFLIDLKDQQVQQLIPSTFQILTDNAGSSRSKGLELEARFQPADGWSVEFGGSITDAEYREYANCDLLGAVPSCNGNKMVNTPEFTANLAVQHQRPLVGDLDLLARVDISHVGKYYFDNQNKLEQSPYQLVNAKLGVKASSWDAYLWVKNALDEYYATVEYDFGAGHTAEAGDPRSVGLTFTVYY